MINKRQQLINSMRDCLRGNSFWDERLSRTNAKAFELHLAILREPYLGYIMEGKKTVESRFSKVACAPYMSVADGDVILLKRTPGSIMGVCVAEKVWCYQVDSATLSTVREKFGKAICPATETFWDDRKTASYVTLIRLSHVTKVSNIPLQKADRRGWVIFKESVSDLLLL